MRKREHLITTLSASIRPTLARYSTADIRSLPNLVTAPTPPFGSREIFTSSYFSVPYCLLHVIKYRSRIRWSAERYVAVKINALDRARKKAAASELCITQLISKANPHHEGRHFVRTLLDSFTLRGTYEDHICLVFEPLREPLWLLNERFEGNIIPSEILKIMVEMLLHGLDYLHTECHIVHTGKYSTYSV